MNETEAAKLRRAIAEFTGAFELVFDRDWDYAQQHLEDYGSRIVAPGGTFLRPGVDPTRINWGARAALLQAYERLLSVMQESGIEPELPIADKWFRYGWPEKAEGEKPIG